MPWNLADAATRATRNEFGEAVEYRPAGGGVHQITAVFDEQFKAVEFDGAGVAIESARPRLDVRLADLPVTPAAGDELTVDGRSWKVEELEPGGLGSVYLFLHRAGA